MILRDQSPTSMKLCPDAGATLEETRSSSEQVTGETVSYSVCEGPGSLLKLKDDAWTSHSSETHSWTLETLLSVCGPDLCKHKHIFIQNTSFTGSISEDSFWSITCL